MARIFSAHAPVSAGDDEEGEEEEPDAAELAEMAARAAAGGSSTLFDDGGLSDEVLRHPNLECLARRLECLEPCRHLGRLRSRTSSCYVMS